MVIKRPVRPFEASSDSDDPLDVIGPSAPPSPPQSRPRPTPARPPPLAIKRTTPSAKYTPRQQVSDDEDLPKSASRSSFAKRRRVLSDSEEEPEVRDESPTNLARFVADSTDPGEARDRRNVSGARTGGLHAGEASVPRPKQRKILLSESEEEDAGITIQPAPLPDDEDAFGLFTADRSSSPPPRSNSKDHTPGDGGKQGDKGQAVGSSALEKDNGDALNEDVGLAEDGSAGEVQDGDEDGQDMRVGKTLAIDISAAQDLSTDQVSIHDAQPAMPTDLAMGETASNGIALGDTAEEAGKEDAEMLGDQAIVDKPSGNDGEPAIEQVIDIRNNGEDIAHSVDIYGSSPTKADELSKDIPGVFAEKDTAILLDTTSADVNVGEAVSPPKSDSLPSEPSETIHDSAAEAAVRVKDGAMPIPSDVPSPSGIEAQSAPQIETDKAQSIEDKAKTGPAEIAEVALAPDSMESSTTEVLTAEDQPAGSLDETGVADDERMKVGPAPDISSEESHEEITIMNEPNASTDITPALRPILPQTPQSITGLPSNAALQPTSSLSTSPDPFPSLSSSIPQNGSGTEMEKTASEPVPADEAEGEEEQEEGEEEIDPEDIEMEEEPEPQSKPSKSSKSSVSEPMRDRDKSESTSTAAESRDTPAPAPVLLNSKGLPRGKPGRKPGWKVGDPLIKERKAMEARAKLGLDPEEKKPAKGKKGKVEALKSAARGRSVSFSETSEPAGLATDSKSVVSETDENGDDDDTIYCSCGKSSRADGNDTLVGCDGCDSWFHAGCVGLSEDEIELVDTFFCSSCEKVTGQKTTMKKVCKRSGCDKQFSNRQSKFCSPACAFQHSQTLIATMQNKKQLQQLASALAHYPPPPPDIRVVQHLASPPRTSSTTHLYNPVEDLERRITETQSTIDNLEKRILISGQAIEACETLPPINVPNGDESGKKKRKPGGGDDRPCGWVAALIWADEEVGRWESGMPIMPRPVINGEDVDMDPGQAEGEYCMNPRKRCDRHSGWRTIIPESFGKELSQAQVLLASLVVEKNNLVEADNAQKAGKIARDSLHELLALRLAKTVV